MSLGTVIITGASRGIGLAIATELAAARYDLALVARSAETLEKIAADLNAGDAQVRAYPGDISVWEDAERIVNQVAEDFGSVWGLVNNAGVTQDGLFMRMTPENWQKPIDINLGGTFYFTRAVAPLMMRQREGRIINISSVIGVTGNAGQANYAPARPASSP